MAINEVIVPDTEYEGPIGKIFMLLMQILLAKMQTLDDPCYYPGDFSKKLQGGKLSTVFDFVIVGGGAAGCILANKLTENEKWNVLILEAGLLPSKTSEVPLLYETLTNSQADWGFQSQEECNSCQGTSSKTCTMAQAKVLGGSSTTGPPYYERASLRDWFDAWDLYAYNESQSTYDDILKYFTQLENFQYINETNPYPVDYGRNGTIPLNIYNMDDPIKDMILEAVKKFDYGRIVNNETNVGYIDVPLLADKTRLNYAKIFLSPIKTRKNLFVSLNTTVTEIITSEDHKAEGVQALVNGFCQFIRAKREVILTAGTINSAKILLLSGIGPQNDSQKQNITVVKDVNTGHNLHGHYKVPVFIGMDLEVTRKQRAQYIGGLFNFLINGKGWFSEAGINSFIGYINTTAKGCSAENPNIAVEHSFYIPNDPLLYYTFNTSLRYCHHTMYSLRKHNKKKSIIVFWLKLLKPKSRGMVTLNPVNGTNFSQPLIIKNNLFSDENKTDITDLKNAFKYVLKIADTDVFREINAKFLKLEIPACRCTKFMTDKYIKCYLQHMGFPSDLVGTVRYGSGCDVGGVVNEDYLVHDVRCLRVLGAGVLPTVTSTNPLGTVSAMALRAADLIQEKWTQEKKIVSTDTD